MVRWKAPFLPDSSCSWLPCNVTQWKCGQIGGQEHFYLETNATLAVPGEAGSMEIFASTQNPTKTQNFCAKVCGVDKNKVGKFC